ncbi:MAG: hypothetical protein II458_01880 [Oscillospiraceae bacterium]|nr:hypothetical protein [Oscillospiraceae bacterium]
MKKFLIIVCALSTVLCCILPAFADPGDGDDSVEAAPIIETVETPAGQTVSVTMSPVIAQADNSSESSSFLFRDYQFEYFPEAGLPGLVYRVFGEYVRPVYIENYQLDDNTTVSGAVPVPGLAGLDWYWLTGVGLFALTLWSFFRFLGVVLKRG